MSQLSRSASVLVCVALAGGCHRESSTSAEKAAGVPKPPIAAARPHQVVSPAGTRSDDYYWLRDDTRKDPEMLAYLKAENDYTDAMLAHTKPLQEQLYKEIVGRIKQDDSSVPYRKKGFWYYRRYDTGKEYPVYARKKESLEAPEQVMLDANQMSQGHGFFQVGAWKVSPDNKLLAWAEDTVGRRQFTLRVKDLETGKLLADQVTNIEPMLAWAADNRTLLYIAKDPVTLLGNTVKKHVLGSDAASDPVVYEEKDTAYYTGVDTTKDDRYLTIFSHSTVSTQVQAARADDLALKFKVLIPRERDHEYAAEHSEDRWIILTNWRAKNFRVVEASDRDVGNRSAWKDILPHRDDAFVDNFDVFNGFIAVDEHSNGLSNVRILPKQGKPFVIDSPEPAYTARLGDNAEFDTKVIRYVYTSLTTPVSTYDFDTKTGAKKLLKQDPVLGFDQNNYGTEHLWASARDGTKVPVSLVYRKGFSKDGTAPLLQ